MRVLLCLAALAAIAASQDDTFDLASTPCSDNRIACVTSPSNCDPDNDLSSCVALFKFTNPGGEFVNMYISGVKQDPSSPAEYTAVGFSKDMEMGDDAVTACLSNGDVKLFYNSPGEKSNAKVMDENVESEVLTSLTGGEDDTGRYSCVFLQKRVPPQTTNQVFNLNQQYYIILATGAANPSTGALLPHSFVRSDDRFPAVSSTMYNVSGVVWGPQGSPDPNWGSPNQNWGPVGTPEPSTDSGFDDFNGNEPHPEPSPEPWTTQYNEEGDLYTSTLYPSIACRAGTVRGGSLEAPTGCSSRYCFVRTVSPIHTTETVDQRAEAGCDPGSICIKTGCEIITKVNQEPERVCCCDTSDYCTDDLLHEVFHNEVSVPEPDHPQDSHEMNHDNEPQPKFAPKFVPSLALLMSLAVCGILF